MLDNLLCCVCGFQNKGGCTIHYYIRREQGKQGSVVVGELRDGIETALKRAFKKHILRQGPNKKTGTH